MRSRFVGAAELGLSAIRGAVVSVLTYIPEALAAVGEMRKHNRIVKALLEEQRTALHASDAVKEHWAAHRRKRFRFVGIRLWYVTLFPAYQVADDGPGYWVYLNLHANLGAVVAYGVTATATVGVATGLGYIQRRIEVRRAELMHVGAVDDDTDNTKYLFDAAIMSAPWQVYRKANAKREGHQLDSEPIRLAPLGRIAQYGLAYGVINTALYVLGEYLPVADWPGFAYSLIAATAVTGGWFALKDKRREHALLRGETNG